MRLFKPLEAPEGGEDALPRVCTLDLADDNDTRLAGTGYNLVADLLKANKEDPALEGYRHKATEQDSGFTLLQGQILLYQGRLVVPEQNDLRTRAIRECHDGIGTAHPGRNKTRRLVATKYWWPGLSGDVDRYVANCLMCHASKHPRDKTPGELQPMEVQKRPWRRIVIDFKKMPMDRHGYDNIFSIIDPLSKGSWLIPCRSNITGKEACRLYYQGPFRLLGPPREIVSDQGPQFKSAFSQEMSSIMGTKWSFASPGHSQTAGQVENLHEYLDQRLRPFINHAQDNWSELIPALDFAQNGLYHESTGLQPHEVMFGFPMPAFAEWKTFTPLEDLPTAERLSRQEARDAALKIQGYIEQARAAIIQAQRKQAIQANKHRRVPDFDVGDKVSIIKKNWSTDGRPSDKLDFPQTRQVFRIIEKMGHAYKLDLPPNWKVTNQFSPDRLRRYPDNPLPGQAAESPEGEMINDNEEWEVDHVVASRVHYGKLEYQVQWRGWDPDPTWWPARDFKNAATRIKEFHDENPTAPGPPVRLQAWLQAAAEDKFLEDDDDDDRPAQQGVRRRSPRARRK